MSRLVLSEDFADAILVYAALSGQVPLRDALARVLRPRYARPSRPDPSDDEVEAAWTRDEPVGEPLAPDA